MTRAAILDHISYMAQFEPAYAKSALRWYDRELPWLRLLPGVDQGSER